MAYFPTSYAPQYYPQPQQPQQSIIWVQGEAGAKSYLVSPNSTVQLWDSEAQVIYLKSADVSGMPSMKILDYTIRDMNPVPQQATVQKEYVTKDEFDALKQEVQKILGGRNNESTLSADRQQHKR